MEKSKKAKQKILVYSQKQKALKVNEPAALYAAPHFMPLVKDFDYKEFKKIADKIPLSQKEWSEILHISERTLQRYAKDNGVFSFSVIDRILQIDKVVKRGIEVFGTRDKFFNWLKINPPALEGNLSVHSLASFEGISSVLNQITRIEHGVLA